MEQDERDFGTARARPWIEQQRASAEHDSDQLDQLFSLISKSQQGYRDLIDTFEDLLFSITLDGTILTVNRSFADLLGLSFADVVGRSLDEFIELADSGDRKAAQESLPRFLERRRWTGVVRAKVKRHGSTHYFDCVLHAIVRNDVVHGISGSPAILPRTPKRNSIHRSV